MAQFPNTISSPLFEHSFCLYLSFRYQLFIYGVPTDQQHDKPHELSRELKSFSFSIRARVIYNIRTSHVFPRHLPIHSDMKWMNRDQYGIMNWPIAVFSCHILLLLAASGMAIPESIQLRNDLSTRDCSKSTQPNPVVLLHGLGANKDEDLNFLEAFLQQKGFCTFSLTYGSYLGFGLVGGLEPIATSSREIASFIQQTLVSTGASQVDIVGHSEGAFQALYVPKFENVAPLVKNIVAIAPPTHGTTFAGLYNLAYIFGNGSRTLVGDVLGLLGCAACNDLGIGGAAVKRLDNGPILQAGNTLTVIASRSDELVTPTDSAFVNEPGVNNIYIQDYCPLDLVGHIGEAYDPNVWNLVLNALTTKSNSGFECTPGLAA